MTYKRSAILLAAAATTVACSWRSTPVPVLADTASITALVGSWAGEYSSRENGRTGSITFNLASARDTAYGDVVMVPRMRSIQVPVRDRPEITPQTRPAAEPLTIRFVRLEGARVSGTLAPYTDPDCVCRVVTTFEGTFRNGSTIEGTYNTRSLDTPQQMAEGRWKVTRQALTAR